MALVTVQRSPGVRADLLELDEPEPATDGGVDEDDGSRGTKGLSECYFANKGAALVLPATERAGVARRLSPVPTPPPALPATPAAASPHPAAPAPTQPDIQHHLQSMFYLLRPEETLKMAVKLESAHTGRTRYLVVVCRSEEAVLLGIDCNERTTVGLVLRVLADTSIKLDGDGGFSVCVCGQQHIFKPVSVQAMWSALQTLHRASSRAREHNHFAGGASHAWAAYYEQRVHSDRSCLNEWHAMDCLESRRPPSPDSLRHKPREREETEKVIRCTLKEIMMTVDLDEVTSKVIRCRLEEDLDMDLGEFKSFIDEEMLTILGQMDAPTEIFDHVYLGSEWNASNLEELQRNGVRHILNVTREIDNFFPGMFDYLNVRVYDDEKTDLLKHWDNTFKYITKARNEGSKVLVHCKMGVSRSASVVIAYAMKAYNWNFDKALKHVKGKRNCIKPNTNFLTQLETYQGILDAMKNREKLQRSKSETNLKSPGMGSKGEYKAAERTRLLSALAGWCGGRPRSWSPDSKLAAELLPPTSVSLENLVQETRHMLMPCANGTYSVSPNQIMRLKEEGATSVKHIVYELESAVAADRKFTNRRHLRLNFTNPTADSSHSDSKTYQESPSKMSSNKPSLQKDKTHTWDPGENCSPRLLDGHLCENEIVKSDSGIVDVNMKVKAHEGISNHADRVLEHEEKRHSEEVAPPSRQSSWSSFDSAVGPDLSRNSSWGSYDTRSIKSQIPTSREDTLHTTTVKKNKQRSEEKREEDPSTDKATCESSLVQHKVPSDLSIISENNEINSQNSKSVKIRSDISDNERKFNETCAILKELAYGGDEPEACGGGARSEPSVCWSRLSASAPTDSWLRRSAPHLRPTSASYGDLPSSASAASVSPRLRRAARHAPGLVKNLKMEFEARWSGTHGRAELDVSDQDLDQRRNTKSKNNNQGLAQIVEKKMSSVSSLDSSEDLSVKVLVDKYDSHLCKSKCNPICESKSGKSLNQTVKKARLNHNSDSSARTSPFLRNSFCGVIGSAGSAERPPMAPNVVSMAPINYPNVVMASVMSKAQTKKQLQHGKTHPLTRLNLNRSSNRCSNPVYNTM